ncbi:hypothetical protein N7462_005338 [Penicillium macrosclerotiorum]|uniref:uncharacterized protein n=1 Tax=Penicillium macrosclerotiorum TaxID=303699 RepID=UPI0025498862|nr:uncharacterized protein N7462_005338 [Penicillium macrosclerotiorum]KAJ5682173.1 hypothetical protein N7462_005338 [Penicillium macrosclerotiorum]
MFFPVRPNSARNRSTKSSSTSKNKQQKRPSQTRSSRSATKDLEPDEPTVRTSTPSPSESAAPRRSSMPGLDAAARPGTASFLESRTSLPYPTFSKAHSKEDVRTREIPTPDPTDLTEHQDSGNANGTSHNRTENNHAPPSPPLTGLDQEEPSLKESVLDVKEEEHERGTEKAKPRKTTIKIKSSGVNRSSSSLRSKKDETTKSSKSARADTPKSKSKTESKPESKSSPRTTQKSSKSKLSSDENKLPKRTSRSAISASQSSIRDAESSIGSDATSVAPNQQYIAPRKLMTPPTKPPSRTQIRSTTSHRHTPSDDSIDYGSPAMASQGFGAPPPPPPPPEVPVSIPRVDYLLQHGGLEHRVPRTLLPIPAVPDPFSQPTTQSRQAAAKVFDPFNSLLDDYQKVMNKNGSLAVATGYRSVARRLLDRLEAVFARDISSEPCNCLMCERADIEDRPEGVSWGEVLELVSGRRELPMWPPFVMAASSADTDVPTEEHIPMQKLDVDVPEEYREHFIRQSRKTKVAVDKWLSEQTDQASSAPDEVDDETLTFAMLTHLESHHRSLFCALLGITSSTPVPRSGDVNPRHRPSPLVSSSLAIQRLYRLASPPRDPETVMFMLNNPGLHHVLATLAAITDDEWDILISGRFDGFLRSGVEDAIPPISNGRWSGSRSNTPFSTGGISRGATPNNHADGGFRPASQPNGGPSSPASFGGPITLDEETEIAALAEIERDIFLGMEALEDAFEALHLKAEIVRRALRERGAGLSVANQSRRGSYVEARLGTPFSGIWESGTEDDFLDDDRSLAPDDSASNISSNRRRRPKRRTERRTPAPVEEEDEEETPSHSDRRDGRNSRRR